MMEWDRFSADAHRYLDGEPFEELSGAELAAADRLAAEARDYAARLASVDPAMDRAELAAALQSALARLTPEQREAFVMKHVDGRSYEEMAELLGVGTDALKMRVYRARDTLRDLLGELQ